MNCFRTAQSESGYLVQDCHNYGKDSAPLFSFLLGNTSAAANQTFYNLEGCSNSIWSSSEIYIYIYTAIVVVSIILTTLRSILFLRIAMRSAENLHNSMFKSLIRAPMRFFDTHPSGRILNRFSRDMGAVDDLLPRIMLESIQVRCTLILFLHYLNATNIFRCS